MRMSWRLGRIAGIDVFLHPTFFLILLLPGVIERLPLVLSLFACVLAHEYGHALTARKFGIGTVDITLYPIGGVARLARMPRAPGAELLIALAGPAVNFVIAGWLFLVVALGPSLGRLTEFLMDLTVLNLILGCFNLIPAFPMDGGRVLRALISGWTGRARATSIAAGVGRTLALGFGVYSLLTLNFIHVALAMFIYFAAGSEEAGALADERRRAYPTNGDGGAWAAPPGYRWVKAGNGVWQLTPNQ